MEEIATLREARPEDNEFLYLVYVGVRRDELAGLGWSQAQEGAFFRMQFAAQQHGYRAQFPGAAYAVIELEQRPVGSLLVARQPDAIWLVDIALLPQFRGKGLGSRLISDLVDQGARASQPVRLSVAKGNRAIALYKRLGFVEVGEESGGIYLQMEKPSGTHTPLSPPSG